MRVTPPYLLAPTIQARSQRRRRLASVLLALTLLAAVAADARLCGSRQVERYRASQGLEPPAARVALAPRTEHIAVGTRLEFDVFNRSSMMAATCRHVGKRAYVFVEDSMWDENGGPILGHHAAALASQFEVSTPADAGRGIYQLGAATFGEPFDADGDPRIFIVVLDTGVGNILGFFDRAVSSHADPDLRRDALFLDADEVWLRQTRAAGTLAHEFQHLIHWGFDTDEEVWINEGLSGYAEELAGYPEIDTSMVPAYLQNPSVDLTGWSNQAYNYGSTYLFTSYLAERYGKELIGDLVAEPRNGQFGIDDALQAGGIDRDFKQVWGDWIAATYAAAGEAGYTATRGRRPAVSTPPDVPFENWLSVVAAQWGGSHLMLLPKGPLRLEFNGQPPGKFTVWVHSVGAGGSQLEPLSLIDEEDGEIRIAAVDTVVVSVGRSSAQGGFFTLSAETVEIPTAVAPPPPTGLGKAFDLRVFPNPFNSQVRIQFELGSASPVEVVVYDVLGQRVRRLTRADWSAGIHQVFWDGRAENGTAVASGIYKVVLQALHVRFSRSISLVR